MLTDSTLFDKTIDINLDASPLKVFLDPEIGCLDS
jgi:hypothetical protein